MLETETSISVGSMEDVTNHPKKSTRPPISPVKKAPLSPAKPPLSPTSTTNKETAESLTKPSFILDWLEKINVDHLDFAKVILQTPDRSEKTTKDVEARNPPAAPLFQADDETAPLKAPASTSHHGDSSTWSPPRETNISTSKGVSSVRKLDLSPSIHSFRRQSIMIGNGWNAKGLEKARLGKWDKALACWENALEIRQQVLGECHPDVANTWNNIGIALGKLNRVPEAFEAIEKALELRIRLYGTDKHLEVSATYHNLANIHQQTGNFHEALKMLAQSLSVSTSLLGKKDIQVARTRNAMGHAHFDAEEYLEARSAYREALGIMQLCHRDGDRTGLDCAFEMQQCQQDIQECEKLLLTRQK